MVKKNPDIKMTIEKQMIKDGSVKKTILERAKFLQKIKKEIGGRVLTPPIMEQIRTALGVSQSAISRDLGVSITAYRQWECGQSVPAADNYEMLQDYFCIHTEEDIDIVLTGLTEMELTSEEVGSLEGFIDELVVTDEN